MYKKLFQDTENPVLDALTQECLEMINCTCALMITSQLKELSPLQLSSIMNIFLKFFLVFFLIFSE